MPGYAESISAEDSEAVRAYVIEPALKLHEQSEGGALRSLPILGVLGSVLGRTLETG